MELRGGAGAGTGGGVWMASAEDGWLEDDDLCLRDMILILILIFSWVFDLESQDGIYNGGGLFKRICIGWHWVE